MEILKTMDYEKFKFLKENRTVETTKTLRKSIEAYDLTEYRPVLVTKSYEIVDGQHRFEVSKELGKPIYYIVMNDDVDIRKAMTLLNTAQKNWRMPDYLHRYVSEGRKNYIDFFRFLQFHQISDSYIGMASIVFQGDDKDYTKKFREGSLSPKWDKAEIVMSIIRNCGTNVAMNRHFAEAFVRFYKTHTDREIKKLLKNIKSVPCYGSMKLFTIEFENIIENRRR